MVRIIGKQRLWLSLGIAAAGTVLLAFPRAAAGGVSRGLSVCGGVILPALFPFLVLGGFLVRSGCAAAIGRRVSFLTRPLFGLPGCTAPVILMAFVGGYPAGAGAAAQLYKERLLTRDEARHLLRFCVCGGPGFIVSAVGAGLAGSAVYGWILYGANVLAALLLGVCTPHPRRSSVLSPVTRPSLSPAVALVDAVTAACETALYLCGFVLLFSAVLSLCDATGFTALWGKFAPLLPCVLEVSSGCAAVRSPLLLGFALGFGGLSVHCQIAAACRGTDLLHGGFFLSRIAHGVLGALLTRLLYAVIPQPIPVFGTSSVPVAHVFSGSAAISAALLVLCGIWMLSIPPLRQEIRSHRTSCNS